MYTSFDFASKKALKEAVKNKEHITIYNPGIGTPLDNGVVYLEGPHYPKPHKWYAKATVTNGVITKIVE